ncbi:MAG: hypothetical protein ACAH95_02605, partial [Fimbriimonas sp.]
MNASSSPIKQLTMAAAILAATVGIAGFASSPTREQHRPEDAFHPELPELNKAYLGAVTQSAPGKTKDGRPLQRLTGFFRSERECMPFEAVRTCGCELRVTPRYFLDDGAGNFREIDLDAERVASYGGPGELEGKWLVADCEISPELKHPVMRNFGVVTASTLQIALLQGDSMIMNGMPETAKRAILKGAKPAGFQKMIANAKPYLTVLCRTSDSTGVTPRPAIDYTTNMKSSYPGFNHFVQNMSYGAWNVDGSALVGWINLPKTKSQYLKARDVDGLLQWDHEKLFPDIMPIIDPTVDFSQYAGINIFMNSQDQVAGSAYATYYLVTQDSVDRWMPITQNNGGLSQSVLGHEDGHNFGFDHSSGSYSTPYDSIWDVMSGGSHSVSDPTLGNIRVSNGYNAYHRYKNGWIWRNRVSFFLPGDSRTIRLERLTDPTNATDPLMAKIYIGGSARHYFTVEARKPVGYDESLPSAVVIHDVLEGRFISDPSTTAPRFDRAAQVVDPDMNGDPNDAAAQWVPGESYSDASAGVTISVLSEDSTGFTVNVSVAASAPMPGKITSGGDDGPGTLRNWLYFKKDFPDAAFAFQIPTSDPSYDPVKGFFRIKLKTPLPIITEEGLVIDGASQTAFTGDTNPIGPEVMLDGADTGEYSDGLILKGANQVVRNLSIGNFKSNGIEVDGAADTVIQRCYIGLEPDGTTAAPNGAEGVLIMEGAKRVLVGGLNQGNVISTNHQAVGIWYIGTTGTRILGNLFGTDRTGTLDRGNLYNGVVIAHGASENEVGSKLAG